MENTSQTRTQVYNLIQEKSLKQPKLADNALTRALRSYCYIPQRFMLSMFGLLGVCNAYTMRVCLNLAITQMVNKTKNYAIGADFHNTSETTCPNDLISVNTVIVENPYAIFQWNEKTQGLLLSAFYYGYATTQVGGGYLADRYGGKWTLGLGLLSTALFTFLTPAVTRAGGAPWLFILRILQGMGEVI